ncbi:pH-response regulator protein palC [Pleurostoma richardsiae]|uniref:pH-response regulator protein palC n=1 Tax=Pleurostoma richardsiae TaxID=41990 RepID=A0AA38VLF2_9PEZI|nr:pH-response regulator protein palC [Pleurostoma richardsiae]
MPFPFVLPTTSAFSFSSCFACDSHPSLPLQASTYRGVVRDALKKHKRLPPSSQAPDLSSVASSLDAYLPYLLAINAGLSHRRVRVRDGSSGSQEEHVSITTKASPTIEWRATLSDSIIPGRGKNAARVKVHSLEHELAFAASALANSHTLRARAALQPLYLTTSAPVGTQERQTAISTATRHLLDAASIYGFLSERAASEGPAAPAPPCPDVAPATLRAQGSLALAEATLLAVFKDDPYPAVVAQDRNANDREWMYKAPDIPKVRAHLFARLCLAAAEHVARAHALCRDSRGLDDGFVRYLEDLRRASRAKACRFFGIDAELGGQTGAAIAWLRAGFQELGVERKAEGKKGGLGGLGRLKKEWTEKREDKKVEKGASWGADAGKLEETRVLEMLETKWMKQNDTMNTQVIPPTGPLLAQMPSGREIHSVKPYEPSLLDSRTLEAMLAPPDRNDDFGDDAGSSDDETLVGDPRPIGAYPGTAGAYDGGSSYY